MVQQLLQHVNTGGLCSRRRGVGGSEIRGAILDRGRDEDLGAFTQAFDEPHLDARPGEIPRVLYRAGDLYASAAAIGAGAVSQSR